LELVAQSRNELFVIGGDDDLRILKEISVKRAFRLESAFHELAQAFYQQCIKQIRARSIPNNFSNLIIRQQFKLAFISELRQDTHTALRHYKLAYQNCIESEPAESELFEWRQVTGLINYKICQLSFLHSTALEAISQQRRHVSHMFATSPGQYPSAQLAAIEFALWKSKQCSMFADLFERAVVNGLAAMSTQHPGIHLHASADHLRLANELIDSMRSALSLSSSVADHLISPQPDPLQSQQSSWSTVVFYGQRPWRVSTESGGGLADSITENNARITLEQRCMPNHKRCLALLSSAMSQFKKYKCVRMQRHIMLLMADEYAALNHHSKALQFISHVLWECRIEKFTLPISLLLSRSLMSSFFVADLKEFVSSSVQILNIHSFPSFESISAHIAMNINRIRNAQPPLSPLPSFQLSDAQLIACQQQWMNVFSERVFFSLSAPRIDAFVRAHASFLCTEQAIASGSTLILKVSLYSCACVAMHFERLRVNVSDASTTTTNAERLPMFEFLSENIELKPNCETNFFYELNLDVNEFLETKLIVVSGLNLEFGSLHSCVYGTLDWEFTSLTMGVPESAYRTSMLDSRIGMPSIKVYPREASVRLEGDLKGDALLGQVANLSLKLVCDENEALPERLRVEWYAESCKEDVPSSVQTATSTSTSITTAQSKSSPLLFLNSQNKLIDSDQLCVDIASLHTTETPNSPVEIPLTIGYCAQAVGTLYIVIKNELIESPMMEIEFFARCDIETMAELVIGDIQWKPFVYASKTEIAIVNETNPVFFDFTSLPFTFSSFVRKLSSQFIHIHSTFYFLECGYRVGRRRAETSRNPKLWVLSQLDAGVVYPRRAPLSITAQICTSQCIVRTAIPILFSIKNLHSEPADLHITIEMTDLFMFAGNKEVGDRLNQSFRS
uniref:Trafficking protein particle complex subunit 11 (inferred by orthology to a human protein) n=1 Tax=Anisakis simplex TaxID=6269 RepID=A0A0M3K6Q7_ANISI